jgi:hypothetical protein
MAGMIADIAVLITTTRRICSRRVFLQGNHCSISYRMYIITATVEPEDLRRMPMELVGSHGSAHQLRFPPLPPSISLLHSIFFNPLLFHSLKFQATAPAIIRANTVTQFDFPIT